MVITTMLEVPFARNVCLVINSVYSGTQLGCVLIFRLYSGIDCGSLHFLTEQRERGNVVVLDPRAKVHSCVFSEEEESKILSFFKLYSLCDHQTLFEKWLCLNGSDVY